MLIVCIENRVTLKILLKFIYFFPISEGCTSSNVVKTLNKSKEFSGLLVSKCIYESIKLFKK